MASCEPKKESVPAKCMDVSERSEMSYSSRDSLRMSLAQRRALLTEVEHNFLSQLCVEGDEIEVQLAHERLMDSDLFFARIELEDTSQKTGATGKTAPDASPPVPPVPADATSILTRVGSQKRLDHLERRKSHLGQESIWRAHSTGLALTKQASRKSLLVRRQSLSSSSRAELLLRPETREIFRNLSPGKSGADAGADVRRRSISGRRSSMRPPTMSRLTSDSSRKSVTFKEIPKPTRFGYRVTSDGALSQTSGVSVPSLHLADPVTSTSSIPSIHEADPIGSPLPSVPYIHMAHPVRSSSVTSGTGMAGDYPLLNDEHKIDDDAGVPSKVEMFHQQRSASRPIQDATKLLSHDDKRQKPLERLVLMRRASRNLYQGEGIEVTDVASDAITRRRSMSQSSVKSSATIESLKASMSFDETRSVRRFPGVFRNPIGRSLSDDQMSAIFLGSSRELLRMSSSIRLNNPLIDESSFTEDDDDDSLAYLDPWKVIEDEYENGYGGGDTLPFLILGTTIDDVNAQPHVLSPPLMESVQAFFPQASSQDNFWLKYSLVRDGASLYSFLQRARGTSHAVLAIETVDGEVFGAFTTQTWRKNWNFFGGTESFLWRLRHSRRERYHSILDQAQKESEIDVYPYTGENNSIQLCTHDKIAVGGGTGDEMDDSVKGIAKHEWGFGLSLENNLMEGTSSPCVTFGSPSLSSLHSDGSVFEISNVELWTLTPCNSVEEAEKLELGKLFLRKHTKELYV